MPTPQPTARDIPKATDARILLNELIDARVTLERCRVPGTILPIHGHGWPQGMSPLDGGYSVLEGLLTRPNINSLHRFEKLELDGGVARCEHGRMLLLGRRQRIAHGGAADRHRPARNRWISQSASRRASRLSANEHRPHRTRRPHPLAIRIKDASRPRWCRDLLRARQFRPA